MFSELNNKTQLDGGEEIELQAVSWCIESGNKRRKNVKRVTISALK